ncbi:MAG TPA: hypothetical protein VFH70_09045 [Acidimicrobiales bacterium]|nr:hypothetical protein [Acidimicrobiales bacterium]
MAPPDAQAVAKAKKLLELRGKGDHYQKAAVERQISQLPPDVLAAAMHGTPAATAQAGSAKGATTGAKSPHGETFENYEAFLLGVNNQLRGRPGETDPSDTSPADPAHLLPAHLDLLIELQGALAARPKRPADALKAWERIHKKLEQVVQAASKVVDKDTVDTVARQISSADRDFVGAAYHRAEEAAEGQLEAPDAEQQRVHVENAEKDLLEAKKLWDSVHKVMGSGVDKALGIDGTGEIIELAEMPGTIQEKLEAAKKKSMLGQAGTAVELAGKIKGATASLMKISADVGERYCGRVAKLAESQGNKVLMKEAEEAAEQWKFLGETAKNLGTAATVIALIGDAISMVDDIRNGKWSEVASDAAEMAVDAAPLLLGAEVAAPLAGVVVLVKAEMEAIHLAAEFSRWCKDEQVREACANYVQGLTKDVNPWATKLVANVEVMLDASQPEAVQAAAMAQVDKDAKNTWQGVKHVAGVYLEPLAQRAPDVFESMGKEAVAVFTTEELTMPAETADGVIALAVLEKVQKIFHGSNLMAKYVVDHYKN